MKCIFILLLFFLFYYSSSAQKLSLESDSLLERGKHLYDSKEYSKATEVFKNLLEYIKESCSHYEQAKVYQLLGSYYNEKRNRNEALNYLFLGVETLAKENTLSVEPSYYVLSDSISGHWGYAYASEKERDDAVKLLCVLYSLVGGVHFGQSDYEKAEFYWTKTLRISQYNDNVNGISSALNNLAELHRVFKRYDDALQMYLKAVEINENLSDSFKTCIINSNIAFVYLKSGKKDSAEFFYSKAYKIAMDSDDTYLKLSCYFNYGDYYFQSKQTSLAIISYRKAISFAEEIAEKNFLFESYQKIALLYEHQNMLDSALYFQKKWIALNQEITEIENEQLALETEARYWVKEKEKELRHLKEKTKVEAVNTKLKNRIQYGFIIGLFVLLVLTFVILQLRNIHSNKLKRHLVQIKQKNDEKDILLKEIHHRVKNNLQVITSLLSLQTSTIDNPEIKQLFNCSQLRINSMALIHEMLYQSGSISAINYQTYLNQLIGNLIKSFKSENSNIEYTVSAPSLFLNLDTAIPLGLLINEIITNSLKYAFVNSGRGFISLNIQKVGFKKFTMKISDDGIGYSNEINYKTSDSLGLKLIYKLARQLNGKINKTEGHKGVEYALDFEMINELPLDLPESE